MTIYEVQKFGVTLEWDSFAKAEEAFKDASPGEVRMYRITGTKKVLIKKK